MSTSASIADSRDSGPDRLAFDYTFTGRMVNHVTGRPRRGVVVTVRLATNRSHVVGRDVTNAHGDFRIDVSGPWDDDNFGLRANGARIGYEIGWVSGFSNEVVPSLGEATGAPMDAGRVKIERL